MIVYFQNVFAESALNAFMALTHRHWAEARETLKKLLSADNAGSPLRTMPEAVVKMSSAKMHLPASIGDYTDFYSSVDHARNVGCRKKVLKMKWKDATLSQFFFRLGQCSEERTTPSCRIGSTCPSVTTVGPAPSWLAALPSDAPMDRDVESLLGTFAYVLKYTAEGSAKVCILGCVIQVLGEGEFTQP